MIPCQVICEFALKGDCGELFQQRCDKNLHMQLHAAALHFHCLSTPLLLANILEGAWLSRERSLIQRRCWLTSSRKRLLQPGGEGQWRPRNPAVDVLRRLSNVRFSGCVSYCLELLCFVGRNDSEVLPSPFFLYKMEVFRLRLLVCDC